jgi:hypothetical protein
MPKKLLIMNLRNCRMRKLALCSKIISRKFSFAIHGDNLCKVVGILYAGKRERNRTLVCKLHVKSNPQVWNTGTCKGQHFEVMFGSLRY